MMNKREAVKEVKSYIKDVFGIFEPDWNNKNQIKIHIVFDHEDTIFEKTLSWRGEYTAQHETEIGFLKTSKNAKILIHDMKNILEIIFGVKK